jgi:TolA-binding protein
MRGLLLQILIGLIGCNVFAAVPKQLNAFSEGERLIYTRLVQAFRKDNLAEAMKQRQLLSRNFPLSVHLDNAYYLTGVLKYQRQNMAEAVRDFAVVVDRYPKSNKRPAALLAKSMAYNALGLKPQATYVWKKIVTDYPGSPEAQRAMTQLTVAKAK